MNTLGDSASRKTHKEALIAHFEPRIEEFCTDCQNRLNKNPLRILDCKKDRDHELMKSAPSILEHLNEESKAYFEQVKSSLSEMGIEYVIDPTLVRGLDYYNHTAFEIMSEADGFGAITTLSGGGRYNGLVEDLGGPSTPSIGFAMSLERLLLALEAEGISLETEDNLDCYLITLGEEAKLKSVAILNQLRREGIRSDKDYLDKKMKAQFKTADRLKSKFVAILGEEELNNGIINVKNMESGEQKEVSIENLSTFIKQGL